MACFLVPVAEAVVTTIASKFIKAKEKNSETVHTPVHETKRPFSEKLKWLNNMLWGGSALLALEHLWHGEIVPWFPFLTAAESAEETSEMLHEMSTVGVSMAVCVTAVWGVMVAVSSVIDKKAAMKEEPNLTVKE